MILDYHPHLPLDRLSVWDLVKRRYAESQASVSGETLECHPTSLRRQGTFKAVRLAPVLFGERVGRERSAVPRQQQPVKPVHTGTTSCPSVLQHVNEKKVSTAFPKKQHLPQRRLRSEKKHKCTLCYSVSASQRASLQQCLHPDCLQISTSTDIYTLFLYYLLPPTARNFSGFQVHTNTIYSYLKQCKTLNATFSAGVARRRGVGGGVKVMTGNWKEIEASFKNIFRLSKHHFINLLKLTIVAQGHLLYPSPSHFLSILDAVTHQSAPPYFHSTTFSPLRLLSAALLTEYSHKSYL